MITITCLIFEIPDPVPATLERGVVELAEVTGVEAVVEGGADRWVTALHAVNPSSIDTTPTAKGRTMPAT